MIYSQFLRTFSLLLNVSTLVFQVSYSEVEILNGDSNSMYTDKTEHLLDSLLPGRNYSITVQAVANGMESNETNIYQVTSELIFVIL